MTDKKIPLNVIYKQLSGHPGFKRLMEYADEMIKTEEKRFWDIDDPVEEAKQKQKVRYFKEFLGKLRIRIKNTINQVQKK